MGYLRYKDLTLYGRLLRQAQPYWPHLGGIFLLRLLSAPIALLAPLPLKIAVDSVVGSHPLPEALRALLPVSAGHSGASVLILSAGLVVAIAALDQLQRLTDSLLSTYAAEQLVLEFRAKLFRHVQRLSFSYHDSRGSTDSTYRIQYDAPAIQWILIDGAIPMIVSGLTLMGMIYVTMLLDRQLAMVSLGIVPALCLVFWMYAPRLRFRWLEVYERHSSAMSVVQEVLAGLRVVLAFGQEDREHARFVHHSKEGIVARIRVALAEGAFGFLVGLIMAIGTATVLFLGSRHVLSDALTLGELLIVMTYLSQLYGRLETVSHTVATLQGALGCAERAFSLLDHTQDIADIPNARSIARAAGKVTFCNVSFAHANDRPTLRKISFEVDSGARIGVVGASGAGKTTLANLLTRFYDPTAGRIFLDDVDLREYKLADLRNQFAVVLQDPVLFSSSIHENIAYARPAASPSEIEAAAKAANAHDFILSLPDGYDTQVGERGMRLSGGERQRVSLARAFLKDAPVLILDEPTSAVDAGTEAAIMEAMECLMRGRTTFIITHRQDLLKGCHLVLLITEGRAQMNRPSGHSARVSYSREV